jgi:hypothetical protein
MPSSERERSERRTYRRSPGRQYENDYDPLRHQHSHSRSGSMEQRGQTLQSGSISQQDRWPTRTNATAHTSTAMLQRPNLRRTRQLLRQNIIASKGRAAVEAAEQREQFLQAIPEDAPLDQQEQHEIRASRHYPSQNGRSPLYIPSTRELEDFEQEPWSEEQDVDPDLGIDYEDPLDARLGYRELVPPRMATRGGQRQPTRVPTRSVRPMPEYEDEYEDNEDDYEEEEEQPERRKKRKKKLSRRGLLAGIGIVALGGASAAAYELAPKVPGLAGNLGNNIEKQLQEAFNRGVEQGANAVRQDFVNSLENLEGFTLDGAMTSVKLMRAAYDTFVSPIVKFGATIATDFLTAMDRAYMTARGWLRNIGQDNSTLAAIQSVLDSWKTQVANMPKQLDAITEADLDGAQAYLRALQQKLAEEKAKLATSQKGTPTPAPTPTSTAQPKQ